ncbi:MAG: glycine--tRNA ligase subunit beta, partial [Sphingomonadales bacterium]
LTARVNQKYFVCRDANGALANAFVCTGNVDAADGGQKIVEGNQKVLAARLSDARFFYDTDLKTRLEDLQPKLEKIVFHEKLGTVADKVDRVAKLARWLVEEGIVKSSPERGGGPRSGGGGVPQATPPADSPLHRPADGPPPRAGEDRAHLANLAERAARLAKADLVTGMVGEFPELQGLMGGYYAAAQGEDPQVAEAIRDHYKPVGQGDDVPTAPVTVAVSLADKLDTIAAFFFINEKPTGSKDPFALRRAALAVIRLLGHNSLRLEFGRWFAPQLASLMTDASKRLVRREMAARARDIVEDREMPKRSTGAFPHEAFERKIETVSDLAQILDRCVAGEGFFYHTNFGRDLSEQFFDALVAYDDILDFFADRLKVQQKEAGVRHDLIDAVFALGGEDDLVRLLARVHALQAFVTIDDGKNLLAGYKRAANILKKEGYGASQTTRHPGPVPGPTVPQGMAAREAEWTPEQVRGDEAEGAEQKKLSYTPETEEAALIHALDTAAPQADAAIEREDFEGAMAALAGLRAPIDAFFEKVIVNDSDPDKRAARLSLLARMRDAVHKVADFSKIEG